MQFVIKVFTLTFISCATVKISSAISSVVLITILLFAFLGFYFKFIHNTTPLFCLIFYTIMITKNVIYNIVKICTKNVAITKEEIMDKSTINLKMDFIKGFF